MICCIKKVKLKMEKDHRLKKNEKTKQFFY